MLAPHPITMAGCPQMGLEWMTSTLKIFLSHYHLPLDGVGVSSKMQLPLQLRRQGYTMPRPIRPSTGSALPLDSSLPCSVHRSNMPGRRGPRPVHGVQSRVQIPLYKSTHAYIAWLGMPTESSGMHYRIPLNCL